MDNLTLAYILIVVGVLVMAAELFIPASGFLVLLGVVAIMTGAAMSYFYADQATWLFTVLGVFLGIPLTATLLFRLMPHTPLGKMALPAAADPDATVAAMPVHLELEQLRGRFGRAVSPLRPAGAVDFDGRRIDAITEGVMVNIGQWVRCVEVKAGKVLVRPVEKPELGDLEAADFT